MHVFYYGLSVREYLNDTFPDKRIGRGSVTSPHLLNGLQEVRT